jgi:hypothetical protein
MWITAAGTGLFWGLAFFVLGDHSWPQRACSLVGGFCCGQVIASPSNIWLRKQRRRLDEHRKALANSGSTGGTSPYPTANRTFYTSGTITPTQFAALAARYTSPGVGSVPGLGLATKVVAHPFIGIRLFQQRDIMLHSLVMPIEWHPHAMMKAWHLDRTPNGMTWEHHPAPKADCTCGIYAITNFERFITEYPPEENTVAGIIKGSGRIVEHETGFRAERASLLAVIKNPLGYSASGYAAMRYGVPLLNDLNSAQAFLSEWWTE